MNSDFKSYAFKKFPITFLYPAYAPYHQFTEKKYFKQVEFREGKERYRSEGGGKVVFVYPKLCVSVLRAYVPASQTHTRQAYFMAFNAYLEKSVGLQVMKNAFPDMVCEGLQVGDTWQGIRTVFKHHSNTFWRTQIYLHEVKDDTKLVQILYRHPGTDRSDDELERILDSFEVAPTVIL